MRQCSGSNLKRIVSIPSTIVGLLLARRGVGESSTPSVLKQLEHLTSVKIWKLPQDIVFDDSVNPIIRRHVRPSAAPGETDQDEGEKEGLGEGEEEEGHDVDEEGEDHVLGEDGGGEEGPEGEHLAGDLEIAGEENHTDNDAGAGAGVASRTRGIQGKGRGGNSRRRRDVDVVEDDDVAHEEDEEVVEERPEVDELLPEDADEDEQIDAGEIQGDCRNGILLLITESVIYCFSVFVVITERSACVTC